MNRIGGGGRRCGGGRHGCGCIHWSVWWLTIHFPRQEHCVALDCVAMHKRTSNLLPSEPSLYLPPTWRRNYSVRPTTSGMSTKPSGQRKSPVDGRVCGAHALGAHIEANRLARLRWHIICAIILLAVFGRSTRPKILQPKTKSQQRRGEKSR